ncbi:MAG: DUF1640 domain-containing protein [Acidobacteria bacterium]|nr:DUF1640 domain-containing protein [Acidobacteriota bacterium]
MHGASLPAALAARLGAEASRDLSNLLDETYEEWSGEVIGAATLEVRRTLVDELGRLQVEIADLRSTVRAEFAVHRGETHQAVRALDLTLHAEMFHLGSQLRQELAAQGAELRQEMAALGSALRQELAAQGAELRQETAALGSALRQEMADLRSDVRQEMGELRSELRQEMGELRSEVREQVGDLRSDVRQELAKQGADLRTEMASLRADLIKWAFVFWVGQVLATVGVLSLALAGR